MYNSVKGGYAMIYLSTNGRRSILSCNVNYSSEGILHPSRIMKHEYDFLYMLNGSWEIYEDEIPYFIQKGDLLILEPERHHYSLEKCSPHMRNMYIHCSTLPSDGIESASSSIVLNKITNCSSNSLIEQLYLQIIENYWQETPHKDYRLSALFDLLLLELSVTNSDSTPNDPLIKEILHLFYNNTQRFYSPEELAHLFQISIRSLSNRFKRATGVPVHQYQISLKLNLAHEQLRQYPDRVIRDIALSFGFYDEFHFSRLFKRQFGYPPSFGR